MPHMTRDSAWRQWKGATRDLARAEADIAGRDINSDDALAELGMPCIDCLEPYTVGGSHQVVRETDVTFRLYAKCGGVAKEPQ